MTAVRPPRLFACTPSRLAAFDCPRRYRFTYVDVPRASRGAAWAHNSVGAAVHLALARWWSLDRDARTPDQGALLVGGHWQDDGFRDVEQSGRSRLRAMQWVRSYLASTDPDQEPAGVERTVAVPVGALAVSGRVDRIDERDGVLVVVDYKTGRQESTEDDARGSLALALYVLGVRRTLRKPCHRVELHHLPSGRVAAFEHTEESLARHVARAQASATDIVAAADTLAAGAAPDDVFPPAPSHRCGWCDFRAHCPEGQAASPSLDPWAGLPEDA